ncbi:MAG: ATP-binding protein [Burkholderiales bacterium]|nr:ATP-binding protein [Burkholderiales bacterium]
MLKSLDDASWPLLRLQVANDPAALEPARLAVLDFLSGRLLSNRVIFKLELVLEETLMNRVWHAFADGLLHHTDLTVQLRPDALVLLFEDDGVPFDPLQVTEPAVPASLAEAHPGGLGLLLTRRASRGCLYERSGGRNRFTVELALT